MLESHLDDVTLADPSAYSSPNNGVRNKCCGHMHRSSPLKKLLGVHGFPMRVKDRAELAEQRLSVVPRLNGDTAEHRFNAVPDLPFRRKPNQRLSINAAILP